MTVVFFECKREVLRCLVAQLHGRSSVLRDTPQSLASVVAHQRARAARSAQSLIFRNRLLTVLTHVLLPGICFASVLQGQRMAKTVGYGFNGVVRLG